MIGGSVRVNYMIAIPSAVVGLVNVSAIVEKMTVAGAARDLTAVIQSKVIQKVGGGKYTG